MFLLYRWYSTRINEHAVADKAGFNAYRLATFGPEWNYDDTFADYTAAAWDPRAWDPRAWVDLFAAGAGGGTRGAAQARVGHAACHGVCPATADVSARRVVTYAAARG